MHKPIKCPDCTETFQDAELRDLHMQNRHSTMLPDDEMTLGQSLGESTAAQLATNGITKPVEFLTFMSAVMRDVAENRITTKQAQAICSASKEMIKMIEVMWRIERTRQSG